MEDALFLDDDIVRGAAIRHDRDPAAQPEVLEERAGAAFAAAFLGSVTLTRRTFHILGTVLGVYLIETGTVGLLMFGAPAFTQQLFAGAVLILATIGARYRSRHDAS